MKSLVLLLVVINTATLGQIQLMSDQMGKPLQSPKSIVEGSPYLFDDWFSALVLGPEKRIQPVTIERVRINLLNNSVEFDLNGNILELRPELYQVVELKKESKILRFKKGFKNKGLVIDRHYEILEEGDYTLLKNHSKSIASGTGSTYGSQVNKVLEYSSSYYLVKGNEDAVLLKQTKKFMKELFSGNVDVLKKLNEFQGNLKNEDELVSFLHQINQH